MPGADYIGCLAADNGISRGMVGGERATMGLRTLITGWTMEWGNYYKCWKEEQLSLLGQLPG